MYYKQNSSVFTYDSSNTSTLTHHLGAAYLSGGASAPTRPGYTFNGWRWKSGASTYTNITSSTNITSGTYRDIYARWTAINYNITYQVNNGTAPSGNPTTYNNDQLPITLRKPTRTGYQFAGWCDDSALTTNCSTTKTINFGTSGNKTYYAKWTQITGTKTLKIFQSSGYVKSKTTTGTTFSVDTIASELNNTGDEREIWVCGDLGGSSSDGYTFDNIKMFSAQPGSPATVPVTSSTMFCSPAMMVLSDQYDLNGNIKVFTQWWKPQTDTSALNRLTQFYDFYADKTINMSTFCNTIQNNVAGRGGSTFWWADPNDYRIQQTTTSNTPSLSWFWTRTNAVNVVYGYKVDVKCTLDSNTADFSIAWPGSSGGSSTVRQWIYATCDAIEGGVAGRFDNHKIYCKQNNSSCDEYEYINDFNGSKSITKGTGGTKASCPGSTSIDFYGDTTCYYKAAWCPAGEYFGLLNGDATTAPCHTCDANYYCDACDSDVENCGASSALRFYNESGYYQGIKQCYTHTNFGFSNAGSDDQTDCHISVYKSNALPSDNSFSLLTEIHEGAAGDHGLYTIVSDGRFKLNSLPTPPTAPTGYHFKGWYMTTEQPSSLPTLAEISAMYANGDEWDTEYMLPENYIFPGSDESGTIYTDNFYLYAMWEPTYYDIAYKIPDINGDLTHWNSIQGLTPGVYTFDSGTITLPTPSARTGYTFGGWYTSCTTEGFDSTCTGNPVTSFPASDMENKTFYSKWTKNTYTVSYKCLSTDASYALVDNRTYDTQYLDGLFREYSAVCPSSGYSASQWTCTYNGANYDITPDPDPLPEDAVWEIPYNVTCAPKTPTPISYSLQLRNNGGTIENYATYGFAYNSNVPVYLKNFTVEDAASTLPNPTKTGYTFGGWCEDADATQNCVTNRQFNPADYKRTVSFYAKWTVNTYTIHYDKNSASATGSMSDQSMTYDVADNLTSNGFSNTGYTFGGWCVGATTCNANDKLADGASVSNLATSGTVTLYAQWTLNTKTCSSGYYYDAATDTCVDCTANNYCPGKPCDWVSGSTQLSVNSNGLCSCSDKTSGEYTYSGTKATSINACYTNGTISCASANPYAGDAHGTATYANTNADCKKYYDSNYPVANNNPNCVLNTIAQCALTLTCDSGYTNDATTALSNQDSSVNGSGQYWRAQQGSYNNYTNDPTGETQLQPGEWRIPFSYGVVTGTSKCSSTRSSANSALSTVSDTGEDRVACWCKASYFTPTSGSTETTNTWWVHTKNETTQTVCMNKCAYWCANNMNSAVGSASLRAALYATPPYCKANTITLTWNTGDGAFGTGANAPTNLNGSNQNTCTYGGAIDLPDKDPTKEGYSFSGWTVE